MIRLLAKLARAILYLVGALIALAIVAYFAIDPAYYNDPITSSIESAAKAQGIELKLTDLHLRAVGVDVHQAEAFFRRQFLSLKASDLSLRVKLLSLATGLIDLAMQGKLYGGDVTISASITSRPSAIEGELGLTDVKLNEHEQIAGLGIISGTANLKLSNLLWAAEEFKGGGLALTIDDLKKPLATTVPLNIPGSRVPVTIPAITVSKVQIIANQNNQRTELVVLKIVSSLGNASGNGWLEYRSSEQSPVGEISFDLNLFTDGLTYLAPFLPIRTNEPEMAHSLSSSCLRCQIILRRPANYFQCTQINQSNCVA